MKSNVILDTVPHFLKTITVKNQEVNKSLWLVSKRSQHLGTREHMHSASREELQPLHIDWCFSHSSDKRDLVGSEATWDKQQIRTGSL